MQGVENPQDKHFPEDWIGSTTSAVNKGIEHLTEEGLAKVNIQGETITLKTLCEKEPISMLGPNHFKKYGANTQFLVKFLDSAIRLHIQCHPTIKPMYQRLVAAGKPKKVAIVACMRKQLVILNTMVKNGTYWDENMA